MYEQLLAEAIEADRMLEATRRRLGEQALRLAKANPTVSEGPRLWQRPFGVLRRATAASPD